MPPQTASTSDDGEKIREKEKEIIAIIADRANLLRDLFALESQPHGSITDFLLSHRIHELLVTPSLSHLLPLLDPFQLYSYPKAIAPSTDLQLRAKSVKLPVRLKPSKSHRQTRAKSSTPGSLYAFQLKTQGLPLCRLLSSAHKVVSTKDWQLAREEAKQLKVLSRIDELKASNLWSFRQLKRAPAPKRAPAAWDMLLREMEWMSEDFRQERRWKIAMARVVAGWIMDWHASADKSLLCVRVRAHSTEIPRETKHSSPQSTALPSQDTLELMDENQADEAGRSDGLRESQDSTLDTQLNFVETQNSEAAGGSISDTLMVETTQPIEERVSNQSGSNVILSFDVDNLRFSAVEDIPISQIVQDITANSSVYGPPPLLESVSTPAASSFLDGSTEDFEGIVPLSTFFHSKYVAKDYSLWDEWGRLLSDDEGQDLMPQTAIKHVEVSDTTSFSSIFTGKALSSHTDEDASPKHDETALAQQPTSVASALPTASTAISSTTVAAAAFAVQKQPWTADEDALLLKIASEAPGNYVLISDALSYMHVGLITGAACRRGEKDCEMRLKELENANPSSVDPSANSSVLGVSSVPSGVPAGASAAQNLPATSSAGPSAAADASKRFGRLLGVFEFVVMRSRLRQKNKTQATAAMTPSGSRIVNLAAHETHKQAQENAGVFITEPGATQPAQPASVAGLGGAQPQVPLQQPLGPGEISLMKESREREFDLHQQNARLMSAARMPLLPGIPGRPAAVPGIPFMHFAAAQQMQQQQLQQQQLNQLRTASVPTSTRGATPASASNMATAANGTSATPSNGIPSTPMPQQARTQSSTNAASAATTAPLPGPATPGGGGAGTPTTSGAVSSAPNLSVAEQLQQQQMLAAANTRRMMGLSPGSPDGGALAMQQMQMTQMQMLAARQMLQQQQHQQLAAAAAASAAGRPAPAGFSGDVSAQTAALIAMQNAAARAASGQMPLDPRQLALFQQQQMIAALTAVAAGNNAGAAAGTNPAAGANGPAMPSASAPANQAAGGTSANAPSASSAAATKKEAGGTRVKASPAVKHAPEATKAEQRAQQAAAARSRPAKKPKKTVQQEEEEEEEEDDDDEEDEEEEFDEKLLEEDGDDDDEDDDDVEDDQPARRKASRRDKDAGRRTSAAGAPGAGLKRKQ
ncbi:chromatin modification- protein VID21 [Entophlyctis luteolus]|nr:chromatin modification- protein VID21 [Entophlyctis luteolus]